MDIQTISKYGATLSTKDLVKLKKIVKSSVVHPFIWGDAAPVFYSNLLENRFNLIKLPNLNHVLGQYDRDQLRKTVSHFPIHLSLDPTISFAEDRPDLYDPRIILYTLYHHLKPENKVNCKQIIRSFGLSITLVGTSSKIESMRMLCYTILDAFVFQLESTKPSSDVHFWLNFIDLFRASMNEPNKQMPFILVSLLAEIIDIVDKPKDSLFYAVKDFVTSSPKLDRHQISSFFINLLTSKDMEWRKCQRMVLKLLAGVRTKLDFEIISTNNLIVNILSLFSNKWVDWLDKILIIQFLKRCVQIPSALRILIIENGLIVWLSNVVITYYNAMGIAQRKEVEELIKLIQSSAKSTDLPEHCFKQLTLIKSIIKPIDDEPHPESH